MEKTKNQKGKELILAAQSALQRKNSLSPDACRFIRKKSSRREVQSSFSKSAAKMPARLEADEFLAFSESDWNCSSKTSTKTLQMIEYL